MATVERILFKNKSSLNNNSNDFSQTLVDFEIKGLHWEDEVKELGRRIEEEGREKKKRSKKIKLNKKVM